MTTFALFTLHKGRWILVEEFKHEAEARAEWAYQRDMLGLDVYLFKKER